MEYVTAVSRFPAANSQIIPKHKNSIEMHMILFVVSLLPRCVNQYANIASTKNGMTKFVNPKTPNMALLTALPTVPIRPIFARKIKIIHETIAMRMRSSLRALLSFFFFLYDLFCVEREPEFELRLPEFLLPDPVPLLFLLLALPDVAIYSPDKLFTVYQSRRYL
jgi:hypothetical protein